MGFFISELVDVEGASLPDGIAVDDAAAYFGITESAEIIVRLNQTDRFNGLGEFFSLTIDLVLQSEFDFEEAANRLGCEGGEIYYLLSGPFNLISISDPLRYYLGQETSEGESGPSPNIPEHEKVAIENLTDIFSLLRLFGIGHLIGGLPLLAHYISKFESLISNPEANKGVILNLSAELEQATEQAKSGTVTPILSLGAPAQDTVPQIDNQRQGDSISPQPVEEKPPQIIEQPQPAPPVSSQPVEEKPPQIIENQAPQFFADSTLEKQQSIDLSTSPSMQQLESQVDVATDAFASQFEAAGRIDSQDEKSSMQREQFASFDQDMDGQLSPREVSNAVNISLTDATEMVSSVDANNDGQVSFEEFSDKPKAVSPKRAPIGGYSPSPVINEQNDDFNLPISSLESVSDLVSNNNVNKRINHIIQSGKNCSRCGIGVENNWIYCPVCNDNLIKR